MQEYANISSLPYEGFSKSNYCHGKAKEDFMGDSHCWGWGWEEGKEE